MDFLSTITYYNRLLSEFIWDETGLWLLLFAGIFTGIRLRFFQVFHMRLWWKTTAGSLLKNKSQSHSDKGTISPFQSMCTSLASTIGVGNIVGVAGAISAGGPGAVFWMWMAAIVGMTTSYSENILGTYYRRKNFDGRWCGGAMYYLRDGVGRYFKKAGALLAGLFAIFTLFASFGIGSMGQVNKIVINLESAFPVKWLGNIVLYDSVTMYSLIIGIFIFIIAASIVVGGIKRIAVITEKVVPFMLLFFVVGCLSVIAKNYLNIIPAIKSIFSSAFNFRSGIGGVGGIITSVAVNQGFKRGVFSNEAGLGSSVIVHASSSVTEPCEQGMWGIFEVFVDTIVVCTMTALVVLTSGVYSPDEVMSYSSDATMVADAFGTLFPFGGFGQKFVAVCIFMFAFTSVLGWSHYGAKSWEYLFGTRTVSVYKILHLLSIICGSVLTSSLAWDISDTFNGLMMIPNLIGVIFLSGLVKKINNNYIDRTVKGRKILPMLSVFSDIQNRETKR